MKWQKKKPIIKTQFFSNDNFDFILKIIKDKNIDTFAIATPSVLNEIVFKISNDVYNDFINTISSKKKTITPNSIEDLLVTLNKITIET